MDPDYHETPDARRPQVDPDFFSDHDLAISYFAHPSGYPDKAQFWHVENVGTSLHAETAVLSPQYAPIYSRYEAEVSSYGNTANQVILAGEVGSTTTESVAHFNRSETTVSPRSVWSPDSTVPPMGDVFFNQRLAENRRGDKEPSMKKGETDSGEAKSRDKQKGAPSAQKRLKKKTPSGSSAFTMPTLPTASSSSSPRRRSHDQPWGHSPATTTNTITPDDSEAEEDNGRCLGYREKLDQRERNRIAASKCRAKSNAAIKQLEVDERAISERHDMLVAERDELRSHVLGLRELLLQHDKCNCEIIRAYLQNAARHIAETGGQHPIWSIDGAGRYPVGHCVGHHDLEHGNEDDSYKDVKDEDAVPG